MRRLKAVKVVVLLPALAVMLLLSLLVGNSGAGTQEVGAVLTEFVKGQYPWQEVEIRDIAIEGTLPDGPPQRIIVEKGLPGRTVFSLSFSEGRAVSVTAQVKAYDRIAVSRSALAKGSQLDREDVYLMLMDVQRIPKDAVRDLHEIVDKQLSRSVPANMPIQMGMVRERQKVKRGQKVILIADAPGFRITATGELKESGYVGDQVKVLNVRSRSVVTGLLTDEGTVKVEF